MKVLKWTLVFVVALCVGHLASVLVADWLDV